LPEVQRLIKCIFRILVINLACCEKEWAYLSENNGSENFPFVFWTRKEVSILDESKVSVRDLNTLIYDQLAALHDEYTGSKTVGFRCV
jgi:hypothetical protein